MDSPVNLTGTSMMELFLLVTTLSMLLFLRSVYSSTRKEALSKKDDNINAVVCKKNMGSYLAAATLDVLFIIFPAILCLTILADWTYSNAVAMTLLVTFFISARRSGFSVSQEEGVRSLRRNISAYRVAMVQNIYYLHDAFIYFGRLLFLEFLLMILRMIAAEFSDMHMYSGC